MPKEDKKFPCLMCSKICLSSGGLKRHVSAIHDHDKKDDNAAAGSSSTSATKSSTQKKKKLKIFSILVI